MTELLFCGSHTWPGRVGNGPSTVTSQFTKGQARVGPCLSLSQRTAPGVGCTRPHGTDMGPWLSPSMVASPQLAWGQDKCPLLRKRLSHECFWKKACESLGSSTL